MRKKPKVARPSGVTVRANKNGTIVVKAFGPSAPDLRDVIPGLFGKPGKKG